MTDTVDFSSRDDSIRHLSYAYVRRRDGIPHDLFAPYWLDVHGPLCSRLPGLGYYAQFHFTRDHWANLWPIADGVEQLVPVFDGAAEIGFSDPDSAAAFGAASGVLFSDEANVFGHVIGYNLPNGAKTYVDREADGLHNGPDPLHHMHVYVSRKAHTDTDAWLATSASAYATSPLVQKLRLHLPERYDNAHPTPPSPGVDHHAQDVWKDVAIIDIAFDSALKAKAFFASDAFQRSFTDQATHVAAIGVSKVSGVYVYVRDGIISTAGLRGHHQAALIAAIGATNQEAAAVTDLFVRGRG